MGIASRLPRWSVGPRWPGPSVSGRAVRRPRRRPTPGRATNKRQTVTVSTNSVLRIRPTDRVGSPGSPVVPQLNIKTGPGATLLQIPGMNSPPHSYSPAPLSPSEEYCRIDSPHRGDLPQASSGGYTPVEAPLFQPFCGACQSAETSTAAFGANQVSERVIGGGGGDVSRGSSEIWTT